MKKLILTLGLVFLCFASLYPQEQKNELRLSLSDCLIKALENNLDISVEAFTPEIREASVRESKERFMPQLRLGYDDWNYNQLSNWFVQGTEYKTKSYMYNIGIAQSIITGGDISLSLSSRTTDTTQSLTTINPSYRGELRFEIFQPLLKNFGPKINRRDVKKAQNQRDISVNNLKSTLIQKVYEVEQAYWNLVLALESLKVSEYSLEHSKKQLEKTREAARIGTKTAIDVLDSETNVASWESRIILDRAGVERAEEALRILMNLTADPLGLSIPIIPLDKPLIEKKEITFEEALKEAYENRPEVAINQKEIESSSIDVSYQKNQLLPQLDLRFQLWFPGQSGDRLVYRDDNPLTQEVIDTIKGGRADSFKDVFDFKYENWSVVVDLNIPLQNFLSRAGLARAKMEKELNLLERERLRKSIYHELVDVFKELKNNEIKMDASYRYRKLMEKKLKAGEEKYRLGIIPSDWLFSYQRELATSQTSEIRAIIDYKMSVAKLEKVLGINLNTKNLKFRNYDF